ncbi:hypothetical protein FRB97_002599 [Tulasnella sp. 331]|nr:hypothetical protein FRB97_002599 [Tulasnella sp. 331]
MVFSPNQHAFHPSSTHTPRRRNRLRKRHQRAIQRVRPPDRQPSESPKKLKKRLRPLSLPDERALQTLLATHQAQITSLDRRVHAAELETFRERLDKEMIIGELMDAQNTGAQARSSRLLLEEQVQNISRIIEGLSFDAGIDNDDDDSGCGESSAQGGSHINHAALPRRLRLIRSRVQAMESARRVSFNEIGDLERELDQIRETFTDRELEWWEQKKRTRAYKFWLQTIQLEYGMALWRHRGLELELLSTHRELDMLYTRVESLPDGDLAQQLFEAEQTNGRIYQYLEAQQKYIVNLEVEASGLRERLKDLDHALHQRQSRIPAYLKKIEEVVENREDAYRRLNELEQSRRLDRPLTPKAPGDDYQVREPQNASPKKNVRFESPPQQSVPSPGDRPTTSFDTECSTSTPFLHHLNRQFEHPRVQTLSSLTPDTTVERDRTPTS